nr:DEAD/DEAH box helicase family protein [Deinococcus humi]
MLPSRPAANGLRRAQHGALQAVGAHFTSSHEPCLLVLPTGSGKTAVMTAVPFFVPESGSPRVLVLTPSRVVRKQVVDEFRSLSNLRATGLLTTTFAPKVLELTSSCRTPEDWEDLRNYDVVVSTQIPVSPREGKVCPPPPDLFQLVLVDEAHHASADTWKRALDAQPNARHVLLTATPYRRDRRELKANLIYAYSLRQAVVDRVFQPIQFIPVSAEFGEDDQRLCEAARELVETDRQHQKEARIIVRTDRIQHAKTLVELYRQHGLKVEALYAETGKHLDRILSQLEAGELDGIVAVGMLGEGFDLPALKIAVVHTPHKSLASTLQFVGRIARQAPERYGAPRFLAVPRAVNDMTSALYGEDPDWAELIPNLADAAIDGERGHRRFVKRFDRRDGTADAISLYGLRPYLSGTVYDLEDPVNLSTPVKVKGTTLLTHEVIEDGSLAVFVTGRPDEPRWAGHGDLVYSDFHLTVYYHYAEANLLLEHSTSDEIAKTIRTQIAGPQCAPVSKGRLSGVLDGQKVVYVQLGLGKTGALGDSVADYTSYASSGNLAQAVQANAARVSTPHHVFAKVDGARYVGFSGSGKVYSNYRGTLEQFLTWSTEVTRIVDNSDGILRLPGLPEDFQTRPVDQLPAAPIAVAFDHETYQRNAQFRWDDEQRLDILDATLHVLQADQHTVILDILDGFGQRRCGIHYDCRRKQPLLPNGPGDSALVTLESANGLNETLSFGQYLQRYPLTFFLQDGSTVFGNELKPLSSLYTDLPDECYVDHVNGWDDCEVLKEFWTDGEDRSRYAGRLSVQEAVVAHAQQTLDNPWVLIDHGKGEMADVIAIGRAGARFRLQFYHCKGAKPPKKAPKYTRPLMGRRVDDLYEVTGQAIKGTRWVRHPLLIDEFRRRLGDRMFEVTGREEEFRAWLNQASVMQLDYEMLVVQPALRVFERQDHAPDRCTRLLLAALAWTQGQNVRFSMLGWNRPDQIAAWHSSLDD